MATWVGLAAILLAAVIYDGGTAFPGYAALLPVLGAALVLAGGVRPTPLRGAQAVLGRAPMRLVGDTSYSLYLWHWPILVLAAAYFGHELSVGANLGLVVAAFLLSLATYALFENPLRRGALLRPTRSALIMWPCAAAAVVVTAILVSSSLTVGQTAVARLDAGVKDTADGGHRAGLYQESVAASVTPERMAMPVPDSLAPAVQDLSADVVDLRGCFALWATGPICHWGDSTADRTAVFIGDSHARMWVPGVTEFGREQHWQVVPLIKMGCVPVRVVTSESCGRWFSWATEQIRRIHPDVIIVSHYWAAWGPTGADALFSEISSLSGLAPATVLLEDIPSKGQEPVDCLLRHGATLGSCVFPVTSHQQETLATVEERAQEAGIGYLRTRQWVCSDGKCPTVIGNVIAFRDDHHLSATYTKLLADPFAQALGARVRTQLADTSSTG
jgi:hypothetical protein